MNIYAMNILSKEQDQNETKQLKPMVSFQVGQEVMGSMF